jgi:hypothetical protein
VVIGFHPEVQWRGKFGGMDVSDAISLHRSMIRITHGI